MSAANDSLVSVVILQHLYIHTSVVHIVQSANNQGDVKQQQV